MSGGEGPRARSAQGIGANAIAPEGRWSVDGMNTKVEEAAA